MLSIENLHLSFQGLKALQGVSLRVPPGEVTAVIGPNGAGKTSLFNCITGMLLPQQGRVILQRDGESINLVGQSVEKISRLGLARTFQQVRLFDQLSAVDNVAIAAHQRHGLSWGAAMTDKLLNRSRRHRLLRDEAVDYLEQVGLAGQAQQLAGNLDHGNRRRLEIARALATHPLVLLLDEPAAGMNRVETDGLMDLLGEFRRRGLATLLIEHDMKLVMQVAQRIFVLDHGEVIAHGTAPEVAGNARVIEAYLGGAARHAAA